MVTGARHQEIWLEEKKTDIIQQLKCVCSHTDEISKAGFLHHCKKAAEQHVSLIGRQQRLGPSISLHEAAYQGAIIG